jgi:hypothetical protein
MQIYSVIMKLFSLEFMNLTIPSNILSKTFIKRFKIILLLFYCGCKLNNKNFVTSRQFSYCTYIHVLAADKRSREQEKQKKEEHKAEGTIDRRSSRQ